MIAWSSRRTSWTVCTSIRPVMATSWPESSSRTSTGSTPMLRTVMPTPSSVALFTHTYADGGARGCAERDQDLVKAAGSHHRRPPSNPGSEEEVLVRLAADVSAEPAQGLGEAGVAAVDVLGAADGGHPVGHEARDDQGRSGSDVAGLDGSAREPLHAVHHHVVAVDARLGPEPVELLHGAEARLEEVLGDHGRAVGHGVAGDGERLQVGREARVGQGRDVHRLRPPAAGVDPEAP